VAGERQVFLDQALRHRMHGHETDLPCLPLTLKWITPWRLCMSSTAAQFLAAHAVIEQGRPGWRDGERP